MKKQENPKKIEYSTLEPDYNSSKRIEKLKSKLDKILAPKGLYYDINMDDKTVNLVGGIKEKQCVTLLTSDAAILRVADLFANQRVTTDKENVKPTYGASVQVGQKQDITSELKQSILAELKQEIMKELTQKS